MVEAADQGGLQAPPTPPTFTAPFGMTPSIASAVVRVISKVKALGKTERNNFDKYDFVSVDKFLAAMGPLLAEEGLFVMHNEVSREFFSSAKGSPWMRVEMDFWLCHSSGAVAGPFGRAVAVPMNGAQAFGSAQSYALKQYLRGQFKVPTGDKDDADYNATESVHVPNKAARTRETLSDMNEAFETPDGVRMPAGSGKPATDPATRAKQAADAIIEQFQGVKTVKGLDGVWDRNSAHIDRLEQAYPALHNDILDAYSGRKRAMEEEA